MSTKGASNRYGNTRGSRGQGEPTEDINYAWARAFNKKGLEGHFSRHGQEFNFNSKEQYAAHAVKFANHIDRKKYKSVVDWHKTTYKYDPKKIF